MTATQERQQPCHVGNGFANASRAYPLVRRLRRRFDMPAWPDDVRLPDDVCLLCEGPLERIWDTTLIHGFTVRNACLDVELGIRRRRQADTTSAPDITWVRPRASRVDADQRFTRRSSQGAEYG